MDRAQNEVQGVTGLSVQTRVMLLIAAASTVVLGLTFYVGLNYVRELQEDALEARSRIVAELQSAAMAGPMWDMDNTRLEEMAQALASDPAFQSVVVMDTDGGTMAEFGDQGGQNTFVREVAIENDGQAIGMMRLELSRKNLDAAQNELLTGALIAFFIVTGVILLIAFFSIARITKPLAEAVQALNAIRKGDLGVQVHGTTRTDEIGRVARAIDSFKQAMIDMDGLRSQQEVEKKRGEQDRAESMKRLAREFEGSVGRIVQALSGSASDMTDTANVLTDTSKRTATQASEVDHAAQLASENVQAVASATEELASSINEINDQVSRSVTIAQGAVGEATETSGLMSKLNEAAQEIGDVVSLINDIASQTNLLALNATIEAARAGDAGKGFAVVASEVKNLANQTGKATEQISGQISGIQEATNKAVDAIQRIGQVINEMSDISTTVAAAVEEQGAATQEIARSVGQAADGTRQVTDSLSGVTAAVSEADSAASRVASNSGELSTRSRQLESEVSAFLGRVREQSVA